MWRRYAPFTVSGMIGRTNQTPLSSTDKSKHPGGDIFISDEEARNEGAGMSHGHCIFL